MRMISTFFLTAVFLISAITQGCSFTTAHIDKIIFAKQVQADHSPVGKTDNFFRHDPIFHCCALMKNTPSGTKIKAVWAYNPEAGEKQVFDSTEMSLSGDGWVDFYLTLSKSGVPYGRYTIALSINGKYDRTASFMVVRMFEKGPISEALTAAEVNEHYLPVRLADTFDPAVKEIFAPIYVEDVPAKSSFTAVWNHHPENSEKYKIDAASYPAEGSGWIGFSLKPTKTLPEGKYSVDFLMNGEYNKTINFTVKKK
jgi:hypothetical protein